MIIGLTGGIASGKTTVSVMLKELGAEILDADKIARDVVNPGQITLERIAGHFGTKVLNSDGTLNRKALGGIVFGNSVELAALNGIIHPAVREVIKKRINEIRKNDHSKVIIVDAPVLLESGSEDLVDEIWLVVVDYYMQIKRLTERDKLTDKEAEIRIRSQMPTDEKISRSHKIIDNSGDLEYTKKQVLKLWNDLKL